ncbi:MAG TPA: hypothetical protein VIJ14_00675 [Rhabdochlamydiaceae bacterium]
MLMTEDNIRCSCGEESTKGCHAVQNGKVVDQYKCDRCFNEGVAWNGDTYVSH